MYGAAALMVGREASTVSTAGASGSTASGAGVSSVMTASLSVSVGVSWVGVSSASPSLAATLVTTASLNAGDSTSDTSFITACCTYKVPSLPGFDAITSTPIESDAIKPSLARIRKS